jgi:hypothetical protein
VTYAFGHPEFDDGTSLVLKLERHSTLTQESQVNNARMRGAKLTQLNRSTEAQVSKIERRIEGLKNPTRRLATPNGVGSMRWRPDQKKRTSRVEVLVAKLSPLRTQLSSGDTSRILIGQVGKRFKAQLREQLDITRVRLPID